jgi:hypothetical protein
MTGWSISISRVTRPKRTRSPVSAGPGERSAEFPPRGQDQTGLDLDGGGGPARRVERDQVPVQHRQFGRGGRSRRVTRILLARSEILQAGLDLGRAGRNHQVKREHILEIAPPWQVAPGRGKFEPGQVDHRPARPVFARNPAGIIKGERAGLGGDAQRGPEQSPRSLAQVGLEPDRLFSASARHPQENGECHQKQSRGEHGGEIGRLGPGRRRLTAPDEARGNARRKRACRPLRLFAWPWACRRHVRPGFRPGS